MQRRKNGLVEAVGEVGRVDQRESHGLEEVLVLPILVRDDREEFHSLK